MADFWTDRQDGDIIEADEFNTAFSEIDKKIKSNVAGNTETLQALATHIADKENPHEVTAEQTGAYEKDSVYNKTEIDSKLVPVGTSETDVDLTTCSSGNGTTLSENITSNSLAASVGTITVTLDADKTYVVKGITDSGGLELKADGVMIAEATSDNTTVSFEYSGKIGVMTAYFSGGGIVTFETFKEITPRDGFMTSSDKAKLDLLPDESGNEFYADDEFAVGEGNKLGTRGFEIISYSGTQGDSGTYMVRGTESDYNALKAVFDTGEELYITILNKENKDSWCKITAVSFVNGNIVITVDNMYTNSESASYDASATYSKTGVETGFPELGWTIQQREAGNADWQKQACFFICGYPELGTFKWFGSQSAFGDGNILQGVNAATVGLNNRIYGKYGFGGGKNNKVGYNGHAFGADINIAAAQNVLAGGRNIKANSKGSDTVIFGRNLEAVRRERPALAQFITGYFNKNKKLNVFEMGGGTNEQNRKNIFEVDCYGQIFANEKYLPLQCISQQNTTFSTAERAQKITDVSSQVTFRDPSGLGIRDTRIEAAYGPYVYVHAQKAGLTVGKWYVMAVGFTNYLDEWNVSVSGFCKNTGESEKSYLFGTGKISVPKGESYLIIPIYVAKSNSQYGFYCDRNTRSLTLNSVEIYEAKDIGLSYKFADRFPDNVISNESHVEMMNSAIGSKVIIRQSIVSELPKCYTVCDANIKSVFTAPLSSNTTSAAYYLYTGNGYLDGLKAEISKKASEDDLAAHKHETDSKIDLLSLKAEKNGEALRISDACEWEQTADVRIASKNLIPISGSLTTKTHNGVTYTVGTDGSITVNGTVGNTVNYSYFTVAQSFPLITGKYYTLSGCPQNLSDGKVMLKLGNPSGGTTIDGSLDTGSGVSFKLTTELAKGYGCIIEIRDTGTTVENLVFKPQLELGTSATEYTPHISDISAVPVKKYGRNLINYPYVNSTKTTVGITFTDNGDGSVTANGTATNKAYFSVLDAAHAILLQPGTYFLSGNINGVKNAELYVNYRDENSNTKYAVDRGSGIAFTVKKQTTASIGIAISTGVTVNGIVFKPQLELADAATDYEPYKAPVTYTPDSGGKVSGVKLGSDTATLMTHTDGVIITVKYKKDITKAFAQLEEKINSLSSPSTVANIETL